MQNTVPIPPTTPPPHAGLVLLLPLLAATEFVENSSFVFASGRIVEGLGPHGPEFAWLLAAFLTGSMTAIALQQRVVHWVGYRRHLMLSLLLFQLGGLGAWLTDGFGSLLVYRLLEGLGGGALFTSGRVLIVLLFSGSARVQAVRRFISVLFGLSVLGPLLATVLLALNGWKAVFVAPLPLALLCGLGVWRWVPADLGRKPEPIRAQLPLVLWLIIGIAFLQLGLSEARATPQWGVAHVIVLLAIGGLLFLAFWRHHERHPQPLFVWHGLRHPVYLMGLVFYGIYYLIANANAYLLPLFANHALGLSETAIGILSSASALITWVAAKGYIRFGARVQPKQKMMASAALLMALAGLGLAWFCFSGPAGVTQAGVYALAGALVAKGVFTALFVLPLAGLTFRELSDAHFGSGYQAKNMIRHGMISIGTAFASVATRTVATSPNALPAFSGAFAGIAAATLLLAVFVALQKRLQ